MKFFIRYIWLFFLAFQAVAQSNTIWIEPNAGQWSGQAHQRIKIPKGHLYIDNDGFFYSLSNVADLYNHDHEEGESAEDDLFKEHHIKATFLQSDFSDYELVQQSKHYRNYYLGQDRSQWASKVFDYEKVIYHAIYPGIDLELYGLSSSLKYNLFLQPGADPTSVQIQYEGQSNLNLGENGLEIRTLFGSIVEKHPIAFYADNQEKIAVEFKLKGNVLKFVFPEGYDNSRPIVIDPELEFSTFTGATMDNWGNTACPGSDGTLFAGGISFGGGYPVTTGAIQTAWAGGLPGNGPGVDVVISKFSSDGTQLLYSTYLGGSKNEIPHSMITNTNNELFVYGSTCSANFPMDTTTAFQSTIVSSVSAETINGIKFSASDAFVVRLSADGTTLMGSTLFGGSDFDAINLHSASVSNPLVINYGDEYRGEVMIDDQNNIYITGTTRSNDIPLQNAIKNTLSGNSDAFVAKFSPDLSNLLFATYLGGDLEDAGNSIQVSSTGDMYVGGGTNGQTFMSGFASLYQGTPGSDRDGYLAKINGTTFQIEAIRWLGTASYDQIYFVQLDLSENVYVYGQSNGSIQSFGCAYANNGRGQFIAKFSNDLTTPLWTTTFGSPDGIINISPTAFLVSDCGLIYVSGWGGQLNQEHGSSIVDLCTTNNLEVSPGAYQTTTSGSNFYIAVFAPDMSNLSYATFIGGFSSSYNHVDGGTSRFDKDGNIYHAVCAACGGIPDGFTSTPGAYSETNNSSNCNMA
ncbi:MAG: WD40 repeat domain-containing protein, partial [Crocinitomicaceae bacterium]|nr:WD40 repeat domain-containing protein [Crocinitomicaceae bacterium]